MVQKIEDLSVYKLGFDVALQVYKITKSFPKDELFALTSQMRRAAVSINSNLVEGNSRNSPKEYMYFAGISKGSAAELMFQVKIAKEIEYIDDKTAIILIGNLDEISRMLNGLIKKLGSLSNQN